MYFLNFLYAFNGFLAVNQAAWTQYVCAFRSIIWEVKIQNQFSIGHHNFLYEMKSNIKHSLLQEYIYQTSNKTFQIFIHCVKISYNILYLHVHQEIIYCFTHIGHDEFLLNLVIKWSIVLYLFLQCKFLHVAFDNAHTFTDAHVAVII